MVLIFLDPNKPTFTAYDSTDPVASTSADPISSFPLPARMCTVSHCHKILPGFYRYKRCEQHRLQNRYHSQLKRVREKEVKKVGPGEGSVITEGATGKGDGGRMHREDRLRKKKGKVKVKERMRECGDGNRSISARSRDESEVRGDALAPTIKEVPPFHFFMYFVS